MKFLLTVLLSVSWFVKLDAQDSTDLLDPVSVTASVQARHGSSTGRNIMSIGGEHFTNLPVHSIDDLLRYLPGVEVQMRGPMGAQSDIVLRGGTFQQVLVLLDGVRINDPNTGHFSSYIPISPSEIERVEVLKGASSAVYGPDAVGGVIQVITRTFAAKKGQHKASVNAKASAGEYGLLHADLGGYYQDGSTALSAGWLSNNSDGQQQRGERGYVHANTASISATEMAGDNWQFSLRVSYDHRDFAAQNFYTSFASDTASETIRSVWTQGRIVYNGWHRHRISMDASYKNLRDEYAFAPKALANESTSEMLQAIVKDEWTISGSTSLVTGAQLVNKTIASNDRGHHTLNQAGVFILLSHSFNQRFIINPALRYDHNKLSGSELTPQLSFSYRMHRVLLRGSAGKTIRDADFTERFNNYNKSIVTSGRVGNPDLGAERSFSYEVGADWFTGSGFKISAGAFRRMHRKLIDYVTTAYADMPRKDNLTPGGTYALARNISKVNTTGAELDLIYQRSFGASLVYAGAGLVWADSKSSGEEPSFYVSSHAKILSNFFVEYRYRGLGMSITGVYKQRQSQAAGPIYAVVGKSYFTANARLSYSFLQKRLSVFMEMANLTDKQYSDLLGAVMPGRWTSGGISFRFDKN